MTESEIMKALECCGDEEELHWCTECPYYDKENDFCQEDLHRDALDLINRKNAEIERLKKIINTSAIILPARKCGKTFLIKTTIEKITESARTAARAEAIKEFAERVKQLNQESLIIWNWQIDQIAKEMGVEL